MFSFFYDSALHFYAPVAALSALFRKKGRESIRSRLAHGLPKIELKGKRLIWVHAVSFGEVKAAAALVDRFCKEGYYIILSTTSQTGYQEAKRMAKEALTPIFLPFDFSYLIYPLVKELRPVLLVITESDFWYNFQSAVKRYGGKIIVVNGKLSERSFRRLRLFPFFAKKLFGMIDHFCLQAEEYRERFSALGINAKKLSISGNLKLDSKMPLVTVKEKEGLQGEYGIGIEDFVITLGSTHAPEERIWLEALISLWEKYPYIKIFLVPRHPERINEVVEILQSLKITFARTSQKGSFAEVRLLLVDQMGFLLQFYQLSDLAFVGGSLTSKVGGHNLIEPANYGVCTLYGPYLHSQPGFAALMEKYGAGLMVKEGEIEVKVVELLENPALVAAYGVRGRCLVEESKGALEKTWNKIEELLPIKRVL